MASKKYFNLDGRAYSAVEIKEQLEGAFDEEVQKAVEVIAKETEKLVTKMIGNSAMRGRGRYKAKYNAPLNATGVVIDKKSDGHYIVVVNNVVFNRIDQGRPALSKPSGKPMRFPVYEGTMTEPNSLDIGRAVVAEKSKWITTREVSAVKPRNLLQQIVDKKAYLRPPEKSRRTRNPFRWRFSRGELLVTVVQVTKK